MFPREQRGEMSQPAATGTSLLRIGVYVVGGLTVAGFLWSSINASYTAKAMRHGWLLPLLFIDSIT